MLKTLFINADSSKPHCSFYESGLLSYNSLISSSVMDISYICLSSHGNSISFDNKNVDFDDFDLLIFNYNHVTMSGVPSDFIYDLRAPKIMLSWEINPTIEPWDIRCDWGDSRQIFNIIAVPNPILESDDARVLKLPRIVPRSAVNPHKSFSSPVIISTYGLPSPAKGLDDMVRAVNDEFDNAIVRMNFHPADWAPPKINDYQSYIEEECRRIAKPGVKIEATHNYRSLNGLIEWLNQGDMVAFFYKPERDKPNEGSMPSATDQAISSKVPMALTNNICCQHITQYTGSYPNLSLRDIIERGSDPVTQMYEDWSPEKFRDTFDTYIKEAM